MGNKEILSNIADVINQNKNINVKNNENEVTEIVDFCGDLLELQKSFPEINLNNLTQNLKTLKFTRKKDITQKLFSEYDKETNTIIMYKLDRRENLEGEKKYYMYKSLLDCAITNRKNNNISYGITDENLNNITLNNALCENLLSLMLDESRHNFYDIEMSLLNQIEEIVGTDIMLNDLFSSKYKGIEDKFLEYDINFSSVSKKIDKISSINFGKDKLNDNNNNKLIYEVQQDLQRAYVVKYSQGDILNDPSYFTGNIITVNSPFPLLKGNDFELPQDTNNLDLALNADSINNNSNKGKAL